jgi:hypothetical protein
MCFFSDTLLCRICCTQSKSFCRLLAQHQNIQWAFKNIAPYSTQYASAVDELMKLMQLFVAKVCRLFDVYLPSVFPSEYDSHS